MSGCRARQYSDQMQCPCGLAWDMNDPDPPQCPMTIPKNRRQRFEDRFGETYQRAKAQIKKLLE